MLGVKQIKNQLRVEIIYILSFADMVVLDNCGWNSCGFCMGTRGDRDRPGVVEDEGNGGKIERERSEVDAGLEIL